MRSVVVALVLGLALAGCSDSAEPDAGSDEAPAPSVAEQLSPADLQAQWWTWSQTAPAGHDPVEDRTGADCATGQPDDVWFLAGTYGGRATRSCQVPADRWLVVPAVNLVSADRRDCTDFLEYGRGSITVDGADVELEPLGPVDVSFDTGTGEVDAVACGLWARIAPLAAGSHTVTLQGNAPSVRTHVDYTLDVGEPASA